MRTTITTLLLLAVSVAYAQGPGGLWKGTIHKDIYTYDVGFDLRIDKLNNVTGYARCYRSVNLYAETYVEGRYDPTTQRVILCEVRLTKTNMDNPSDILPGRYDLTLLRKPGTEELAGYLHCLETGNDDCNNTLAVRVKKLKDKDRNILRAS